MLRLISLESAPASGRRARRGPWHLAGGFPGRDRQRRDAGHARAVVRARGGPGLHRAIALGPQCRGHDQHARPGDDCRLVDRRRHRLAGARRHRARRHAGPAGSRSRPGDAVVRHDGERRRPGCPAPAADNPAPAVDAADSPRGRARPAISRCFRSKTRSAWSSSRTCRARWMTSTRTGAAVCPAWPDALLDDPAAAARLQSFATARNQS